MSKSTISYSHITVSFSSFSAAVLLIHTLLLTNSMASPILDSEVAGRRDQQRHFVLPLGGYLGPLSGYVRSSFTKLGYHPPSRYDKRHFDSLAGQSLGKRSGGSIGYPPADLFRPYAYGSQIYLNAE